MCKVWPKKVYKDITLRTLPVFPKNGTSLQPCELRQFCRKSVPCELDKFCPTSVQGHSFVNFSSFAEKVLTQQILSKRCTSEQKVKFVETKSSQTIFQVKSSKGFNSLVKKILTKSSHFKQNVNLLERKVHKAKPCTIFRAKGSQGSIR